MVQTRGDVRLHCQKAVPTANHHPSPPAGFTLERDSEVPGDRVVDGCDDRQPGTLNIHNPVSQGLVIVDNIKITGMIQ